MRKKGGSRNRWEFKVKGKRSLKEARRRNKVLIEQKTSTDAINLTSHRASFFLI